MEANALHKPASQWPDFRNKMDGKTETQVQRTAAAVSKYAHIGKPKPQDANTA